ncbi:trub family pseudouridylate synthase-containing protein [Peziza echinospora]|nr:trub family pseudouridylate synthase-containing protein [Peziza echinospora]
MLKTGLLKMATPALEGLFAVNKPPKISSAQALRNLQYIFRRSPLFKETLKAERQRRMQDGSIRGRKKHRRVDVKIGHGGTLDPMATGVLVIGLGSGTKKLPSLLGGIKEYEAVMLLGADTDTYDRLGKVVKRAEYAHVTREMVEKALEAFRGDIMQVPPIYSALNMNGKRLYEYARSGEPLPMEIKARPMKVDHLELVDFTTEHDWDFPEEGSVEEKKAAEYIEQEISKAETAANAGAAAGAKKLKTAEGEVAATKTEEGDAATAAITTESTTTPTTKPAIIKVRLIVSSGFYVRSFIHDLGLALGSAAHMVSLVRTRQSAFELGKFNTIEWSDFGECAPPEGYRDGEDEADYNPKKLPKLANGRNAEIDAEDAARVEREGSEEPPKRKWEVQLETALLSYMEENAQPIQKGPMKRGNKWDPRALKRGASEEAGR